MLSFLRICASCLKILDFTESLHEKIIIAARQNKAGSSIFTCMSADHLQKIRVILETMLRDELLPVHAATVVANLSEKTTPDELGMDSLARFSLLGELRKAFGKRIDPIAISAAKCVGDVIVAIKNSK